MAGSRVLAVVSLIAGSVADAVAQDTTVVRIEGPPVWGSNIGVVEEITIGSLDGAEEYVFGSVWRVAGRRDGTTFVYDGQGPLIRQYDSAGRYVRSIGRDGEGPGEYRQLIGMRVLRDDRLAVWDPNLSRITIYDTAGEYLASHRIALASGLFAADVFQVDASGTFYVTTVDVAASDPASFRPGGHAALEPAQVVVRVTADGRVVDSIRLPQRNSAGHFAIMSPEGPRPNFPDEVVYAMGSHGGLVMGQSTRYAIAVHLPDGSIRRLVRDVPTVALTSGERAQWQAWAKYFAERRGASFRDPPRTKPAFRRLWSDVD